MLKIDNSQLTHIAFDADDTLWGHEHVFVDAKARCTEILLPYLDGRDLEGLLYEYEKRNLSLFGYGVKGFLLSMMETAIEISGGAISGGELQQIIDLGKEMLEHPIELLKGVREAIDELEDHYQLMIITKGDLFDQENKIARSGIGDHFSLVEIVSEKSTEVYQKILQRHKIAPQSFLMLGNSLRSDILPVLQAGSQAIHIPYHYTWMHEAQHEDASARPYAKAADMYKALCLITDGVVNQ
ncbi:MAG: HAD family hydrolase [Bacteroidota bacterium]